MQYRFNGEVLSPTRRAGVCLPISSLPSRYGIGEIGDQASAFIDAIVQMELGVWQFLPLGPTAYSDSPYQPLSSFAGNELLIDVADLINRGLVSQDEAQSLTGLPADHVDYGALIPLKSGLLTTAASRFSVHADASLKAGFDEFVERHNTHWLHDYALFRILKSQHGERPWPQWLPEYVHRDPDALRQLEVLEAQRIVETKILQFLFYDQWRRLHDYARESGVTLFGDMPIYIALDSADAWANRDLLRIDEDGRPNRVAGVPPDYFSEDGQLWGNPLYDWNHHEASGYEWWIQRLRAAVELVDLVRIDHFRGFESYWSVPAGSETARVGKWESGPGGAIFDAMHESLGQLPMVAEDLGVITPEVEALRDRHNIPGMVVLQFAVTDPQFDIQAIPENCVCYSGTHDNDTTLGWFRGSANDIRSEDEISTTRKQVLDLTGGSEETVAIDLVRIALSTDARLVMAPMQDYLGLDSDARINTPGTTGDNWRWRVLGSQLTDELYDRVAIAVRTAGRQRHSPSTRSP